MTVNAGASKHGEYFLVGINYGVLYNLFSFFHSKSEIFKQPEFSEYSKLFKDFNLKPQDFLTVIAFQFIFFHEIAHLVQLKSTEDFSFNENSPEYIESENVFSRHVHEFDADWFGSCKSMLASLKLLEDRATFPIDGVIKQVTTLVITSIASYFIESSTNKPLYFEELKHPHNFIRFLYITEFILLLVIHNFPTIAIAPNEITSEFLRLANAFFFEEKDNPFINFIEAYQNKKSEINIYIQKLKKQASQHNHLALQQLHSKDMSSN